MLDRRVLAATCARISVAGALALALAGSLPACGSDEPECTGFGCPSGGDDASTSASMGGSSEGGGETTPSSTSSTTGPQTTGAGDGTDGSEVGGSTSMSASEGAESAADSSTGASCDAGDCALGECFGVGIWRSCAQYCEAADATCVEGGCDGATAVYYDDGASCADMMPSGSTAAACDAPFTDGGGISFIRCCCG